MKKIVRLTEGQLYRLIEQALIEEEYKPSAFVRKMNTDAESMSGGSLHWANSYTLVSDNDFPDFNDGQVASVFSKVILGYINYIIGVIQHEACVNSNQDGRSHKYNDKISFMIQFPNNIRINMRLDYEMFFDDGAYHHCTEWGDEVDRGYALLRDCNIKTKIWVFSDGQYDRYRSSQLQPFRKEIEDDIVDNIQDIIISNQEEELFWSDSAGLGW